MCLEILTSKSKRAHKQLSIRSQYQFSSLLLPSVVSYISCGYSCCEYTVDVLHFSSVHVLVFFPELD